MKRTYCAFALTVGLTACNPPAVDSGPGGDAIETPSTSAAPLAVQNFAGSVLTTERATSIADDAGFDYIGHSPCPQFANNCAIFYVRSRNASGRLYTYQVSSQACPSPLAAAHLGLAPASTAPPTPPPTTPLPPPGQTPGNASACFGAYTTIFRAKQEGFAFTDDYGYYAANLELSYQTVDHGAWRDLAAVSMTRAALDDPGSNQTLFINSSVLTDGDGQEVDNSYEAYYAIAGSDGSITDKDRCDATASLAKARYVEVAQVAYSLCVAAVGNGTLTVDLDIGVGAQYEDNLDLCQNALAVGLAAADTVQADLTKQCYDKANLNVLDAPTPKVLLENAIKQSIDGNVSADQCNAQLMPPFTQTLISSDNTIVCDVDVAYKCEWKPAPGSDVAGCRCTKTSQESVCTDLDP